MPESKEKRSFATTRLETEKRDAMDLIPDLPESFRGFPSPAPTTCRRILIAVFVAVTIVVAVFPVAMVTVMFTVFVPFSFFAGIPLTIVPLITVMLVPFAVVSARYGNGELLR
jgi:hypothetical protein